MSRKIGRKITKPVLTVELLCSEARRFAEIESKSVEPALFGVTDGKAVGTYLEHKFQRYLRKKYVYESGSSAKGIDFPQLEVDIKVTSITQPQSSCPFSSARQKIYGLGYSLIIFVYEKIDNPKRRASVLDILHTIYVDKDKTGDYQTTTGILKILENNGNEDDLLAFLQERMLPADEIESQKIVKLLIKKPPEIGYLTISNALQWRLQYRRVIEKAGTIAGIIRIR
jgi:hypothetical protein